MLTSSQVTTGNLNLAVRRNRTRFPADFMFQLTKDENASLVLQSAIAKRGRGGRQTPPHAFTELGVAMLSSVLNSERAVQINILIMRAFVRLRTKFPCLLSRNIRQDSSPDTAGDTPPHGKFPREPQSYLLLDTNPVYVDRSPPVDFGRVLPFAPKAHRSAPATHAC